MLKIFLKVVNKSVIYCVLSQDESLRNINRYDQYEASVLDGKLKIISCGVPELFYSNAGRAPHVALRGLTRADDERICSAQFDSVEEAVSFKNLILDGLEEFKQSGYFGNTISYDLNDSDIYQF